MAPPSRNCLFACNIWGGGVGNNIGIVTYSSQACKIVCFPRSQESCIVSAEFWQQGRIGCTLSGLWLSACLSLSYLFRFELLNEAKVQTQPLSFKVKQRGYTWTDSKFGEGLVGPLLSSSTHSWAMRALLTVWFCWRTSVAGSGRWWWEPPGWCTWSWPRRPPGFGSDCVSEHRSLSHRKAPTVTGSSVWGRTLTTIPVFPPGSESRLGRLARGISLDQGRRRIWAKGLGDKQSMLFIPFFKKKKKMLSLTGQGALIRDGLFFFPSACLWDSPGISCHSTDRKD